MKSTPFPNTDIPDITSFRVRLEDLDSVNRFEDSSGMLINGNSTKTIVTQNGKCYTIDENDEAYNFTHIFPISPLDSHTYIKFSYDSYDESSQKNVTFVGIYQLDTKKIIFKKDESLYSDGFGLEDKGLRIGGKTYWLYHIYDSSEHKYYGFVDQNGKIVVDAEKEKYDSYEVDEDETGNTLLEVNASALHPSIWLFEATKTIIVIDCWEKTDVAPPNNTTDGTSLDSPKNVNKKNITLKIKK